MEWLFWDRDNNYCVGAGFGKYAAVAVRGCGPSPVTGKIAQLGRRSDTDFEVGRGNSIQDSVYLYVKFFLFYASIILGVHPFNVKCRNTLCEL